MALSFSNPSAGELRHSPAEEVVGRAFMLLWFAFAIYCQPLGISKHVVRIDPSLDDVLDLIKDVLALAFSVIAVGATLTRRESKATAKGLEPRLVAIFGGYLMVVIPLLPYTPPSTALKLAGDGLMIVGTCTSVYCLTWLGRSFSVMATARNLVTAGPYGLVRHPLYACECATLLGLIVATFSPAGLAVGLITLGLLWRRAINEERILRSAFHEYDDYARRVPRIVPRFLSGGMLRPAEAGSVFGA